MCILGAMPRSFHHAIQSGGRMLYRLLAAALGLVTLAGCKPPPQVVRGQFPLPKDAETAKCEPGKYGGVFVVTDSTEPKTFNPLVPSDQTSAGVQGTFLSGLVTLDPFTQNAIPALAKSWEIGPDKKTYTFHLREGVKWSDGAPFTADDVIFTLDCVFAETTDPQTGKTKLRYPNRTAGDFSFGGKHLQYRKIDDNTVEFFTPEIFSPFILNSGDFLILPKHKLEAAYKDGTLLQQWSSQTAIDHPEELVGLGAFVVAYYKPGEQIVFTPNPHYWRVDAQGRRLPYLDAEIVQFVASAETELLLFATGQADHSAIPATDVPWVARDEKLYDFTVLKRGPSPGAMFFWFNLKPGKNKDGKPYVEPYKLAWFSNPKFRQAVMYGFDREGIVKGVYFGRAEPQRSIISQGNPKWFNPDIPQYSYDPEKARALLKEAGFHWATDGRLADQDDRPVAFELLLFAGSAAVSDMATVFKQNMHELGIEVKLTAVDFSVVLQKTDSTFDYDMSVIGWGSSAGATDPSGNKALFRSDGEYHVWNPSQPAPATDWEKRLDALVDAQEQTFDDAERKAAFNEIQSIFAEQLPLLYLVTPYGYQGIQNKWRNVRPPPSGTILWNIDEIWTNQP